MTRTSQRLPGWASNLLLSVGALLFTFLALEIGVRLFVDVRDFTPIAVYGIDPNLPIRFLPHYERTFETREYRYQVRTNRFGRRDVEWSPDVIADPANVIFIGDSFVFGNGVEQEATLATRLEQRFLERGAKREVFNFGIPGGGPGTYLALAKHAIDSGFAARTLLVAVFVGNDFYRGESEDTRPTAVQPPRPDRERTKATSPGLHSELFRFLKLRLSTSTRAVGWALTAGRLLGLDIYDTAGSYIFLRDPTPGQAATFERILDILGRIQDLAKQHDRELRVVIIPNRIQVENGDDLTNRIFDAARPDERILAYWAERGVPCLDLLPVLAREYAESGESLYYAIDRHLNERGTQVAADAIGRFLEETEGVRRAAAPAQPGGAPTLAR